MNYSTLHNSPVNTIYQVKVKSPAALAPNKRISQFFDALKPGIDFSPAMKLLDSIFFQ